MDDDQDASDAHAAWQAQVAETQRLNDAERDRYRAANPLWDKCRVHHDRLSLVPFGYPTGRCVECQQNAERNYIDLMIERDRGGMNDPRNWTHHHDMQNYRSEHTPNYEKERK